MEARFGRSSSFHLCLQYRIKTNAFLSQPVDAGGAPEGPPAAGLPAAESGSAGSPAAEAVGPGEEPAGAGVSAPEAGSAAAQPQAALLPQTVAAGMQEGHRVEGRLGGTRGGAFVFVLFF